MCRFLLTMLFAIINLLVIGQSQTIRELTEKELVTTDYHFYPSTLRMINLQRDPDFDKLVKTISKLDFFSLNSEKFDKKQLRETANRMISEEGYETYLEMDGPDVSAFVLGKSEEEYTCVLGFYEEEYVIAEIQGTIDLMQLSEVYQKISRTGLNS